MEYLCSNCKFLTVDEYQSSIKCKKCDQWTHAKCVKPKPRKLEDLKAIFTGTLCTDNLTSKSAVETVSAGTSVNRPPKTLPENQSHSKNKSRMPNKAGSTVQTDLQEIKDSIASISYKM